MNCRLIIHRIGHLVTMNPAREILTDAHVIIEKGAITSIGTGTPETLPGDELLDARGGIALPGLVNTHHHLFQNLARAYTPIANAPLFPWIEGLIPVFRHLNQDDLFLATQVGLAELMLSGCTLCSDHHYLFPRAAGKGMMDAGFEAARAMGCRYVACRGSVQKSAARADDWMGESVDEILMDSQRLHDQYHQATPDGLLGLALAPGSIFSGDRTLFQESARLARSLGLGLHTHLGEVPEESDFCLKQLGRRPVDLLEEYEWTGERVWLAHGIHFSDQEIAQLGRMRVGVAHCPCCNMRMGSGVCRVRELTNAGVTLSLGVDGSASNDSGHMLNEVRLALFLTRVVHGAGSMTVDRALEMATLGGAKNLGRSNELGSLEVGKRGDIAIFPADDIWSNGAENKVHALFYCHPRNVQTLLVEGNVRVRDGQLVGVNLEELLAKHRKAAHRLQQSGRSPR